MPYAPFREAHVTERKLPSRACYDAGTRVASGVSGGLQRSQSYTMAQVHLPENLELPLCARFVIAYLKGTAARRAFDRFDSSRLSPNSKGSPCTSVLRCLRYMLHFTWIRCRKYRALHVPIAWSGEHHSHCPLDSVVCEVVCHPLCRALVKA